MKERHDVVVVGAGNAAFSAAHAAIERVGRVLVLEKAPREWAEGNSYFTAGAIRTTYDGLEDLRPIVENLTDELAAATELPPYTPDDFMSDMERVTEGRSIPVEPEVPALVQEVEPAPVEPEQAT